MFKVSIMFLCLSFSNILLALVLLLLPVIRLVISSFSFFIVCILYAIQHIGFVLMRKNVQKCNKRTKYFFLTTPICQNFQLKTISKCSLERDAFFKFRINIFCSSLQFCNNASTGTYQSGHTALIKIRQILAVLYILYTRCTGMKRFCRNCVQLLQLTQRGKHRCWLQSSEFCSTRIRYYILKFLVLFLLFVDKQINQILDNERKMPMK